MSQVKLGALRAQPCAGKCLSGEALQWLWFPSAQSQKNSSAFFFFRLLKIPFVAVRVSPKQSHVRLIPFLREVGVLSILYILLTLRAARIHQR